MPTNLPPAPIGEAPGSFAWQQWYIALSSILGSSGGTIPWSLIDTSGSDIQDIAARAHNNMQSIQGGTTGQYYHLKVALKGSKAHDFASIASGAVDSTTINITGATTTSTVALGYSSTPETGIEFRAWVSAADTVTLQAINRTAGAIDPASRTYYVLVMDN
jgi:hypothetical protein